MLMQVRDGMRVVVVIVHFPTCLSRVLFSRLQMQCLHSVALSDYTICVQHVYFLLVQTRDLHQLGNETLSVSGRVRQVVYLWVTL